MKPANLSVIIPTYYRYEPLKQILTMLSRQTVLPLEIIIADQTPLEDRPKGFYENFPDIPLKVLNLKIPGLSSSRNAAARTSQGAVLLFLDDDMIISPTHLETHLEVLNKEYVDVVYGAVSSKEILPEKYERDWKTLDPVSQFLKSPNCRWNGMVLVTSGANTSIKREIFLSAGGYDEKMPRMEDHELGYRLFRSGAKIYYSEKAFARHNPWPSGGTRKTQPDMQYMRLLSRLYIHYKHFPGWTTRQYLLKEIVNALTFRELVSSRFHPLNLYRLYMPVQNLGLLFKAARNARRLTFGADST
ncbi:MAG: glycosyltransferase family 2 protein [Promethearchaeota archaeon]